LWSQQETAVTDPLSDKRPDGVLRHVAKSLDACGHARGIEAEVLEGEPQHCDRTVAGRLGASGGSTERQRLASNEPRLTGPVYRLEFVEHPRHVLCRGHDIGRGHVDVRTEIARHLTHPSAAHLLLLAQAERARVALDRAFRAAERKIRNRTLPRHRHRERAYLVDAPLW
jgi:hypothetical protein